MGLRVPYSEAFARKYPETIARQHPSKRDGFFDEDELLLLNPTETAYLIADGTNAQFAAAVFEKRQKLKSSICSILWLTNPSLSGKISCLPQHARIRVEYALPPGMSDPRYGQRLDTALHLLTTVVPPGKNVFADGLWNVVPKDSKVLLLVVPSLDALRGYGISPDSLPPSTQMATNYRPDPVTGEPTITVYVVAPAISRQGFMQLTVALGHEFFGHVYNALMGRTKAGSYDDEERSAARVAIDYADQLRPWVRTYISDAEARRGLENELDLAVTAQREFLRKPSAPGK